jgi:hypothetical protein
MGKPFAKNESEKKQENTKRLQRKTAANAKQKPTMFVKTKGCENRGISPLVCALTRFYQIGKVKSRKNSTIFRFLGNCG